jgi:hypothetical protein
LCPGGWTIVSSHCSRDKTLDHLGAFRGFKPTCDTICYAIVSIDYGYPSRKAVTLLSLLGNVVKRKSAWRIVHVIRYVSHTIIFNYMWNWSFSQINPQSGKSNKPWLHLPKSMLSLWRGLGYSA